MKNTIAVGEEAPRNPKRQVGGFINPPRAHIDKGFDAFYTSPQWRAFRAQIAAERGAVCEDKEHDPKRSRTANVELDHIVELADGGAPLDRSNVMFRCRSCHVSKTRRIQAERSEREYWEAKLRRRGGEAKISPSDALTTAPVARGEKISSRKIWKLVANCTGEKAIEKKAVFLLPANLVRTLTGVRTDA